MEDIDLRPCRNNCGFMGRIETGYYCSQCYKERTGKSVNDIPLDPPGVGREVVFSRRSDGSSKAEEQPDLCSTCVKFYGSHEYGGLCHTCFMAKTASPGPPEPNLCKRCKRYYGSEEFGGLCNECFMALTKEQTVSPGPIENQFQHFNISNQRDNNGFRPLDVDIPAYEVMTGGQPIVPRPSQHHSSVIHQQSDPPGGVQGHVYEDPDTNVQHQFNRGGSSNNRSSPDPVFPMDIGHHPPLPPINPGKVPPVPAPRRSRSASSQQRNVTTNLVFPKPLDQAVEMGGNFDTLSSGSCFVCDPNQPIQLLNVVCQQHARTIRETYKTKENEVHVQHGPSVPPPSNTLRAKPPVDMTPHGVVGRGEVFTSPQLPISPDNRPRAGGHLGRAGSVTGHHGYQSNTPPINTMGRGNFEHQNPLPMARPMTEPVQQCCNVSCNNLADVAFHGFCENCYRRMSQPTQERQGSGHEMGGASSSRPHPLPTPPEDVKPPKMLCRTPGCSFYPLSGLHGYCKDCYNGK